MPVSACDRVQYVSPAGSVTVSALTKQIFTVTNRLLALPEWGGEVEPMTALQGGWRDWTSYSGPTHREDAVDLTDYNWRNRFHWLDLLGHCPFHRTRSQGDWVPHIHTLCNGLGCVDPYARGQIVEAKAGGDGLRGNRPDPDAGRRSGLWPLAIFGGRTGRLVTGRGTTLHDGPASTRKKVRVVQRGTKVRALMEVRNKYGRVWFVTDEGLWGYSPYWNKA